MLSYFAKIQRPRNPVQKKDITTLQNKYRIFRIILEPCSPQFQIENFKFQICNPYLPTKTLLINIDKSETAIIKGFKKDVQRAIAKCSIFNFQSPRDKLCLFSNQTTKEEIHAFHKAWRKAVPWGRYVPPPSNLLALKKSFGKNCALYSCINTRLQTPINGVVFLIADNTLYYYLAWSNKKYSHTADMYRLVWEGIKWGKSKGCTIFDFEGIYDSRFPNKSWLGFSHFKSRFGGKEVLFPGSFNLNYKKI